ncbi:Negative cofactor 2 complex subunit beta [Mycena sanguinolenta]|uniref:Negative cofactor 2 complex subunit beta n=1 Tax=Mycena sanguinolenta TaxID=230812 RepID=A0A8H6YAZ7_9AGAR|nr:Negative cofactor 2 complex subunit beta [Mycena sanguinolenta]
MSDREGPSGGAPPSDDDLSLPKATVAKMITGTRPVLGLLVRVLIYCRITAQRRGLRQRNAGSGHRVLCRRAPSRPFQAYAHADYVLLEEFIHLISSEANEICEQESKKTIAPEHIISALKASQLLRCVYMGLTILQRLGFDSFTSEVEDVLKEHKQQQKDREKKVSKFEQSGMTTEELLAAQEQLFAASRAKFQSTSGT